MNQDINKENEYYVPDNFGGFDSIKDIPVRNVIEALVVSPVLGWLVLHSPFVIRIKIMLLITVVAITGAFFLMGIQGLSVTQFVYQYLKFRMRKEKYKRQKPFRPEIEKGKKKNKKTIYPKNSTQNWLGLEEIQYGIAVFNDNGYKRYVKILEVAPTNFHLMSNTEKNNVVEAFYSWIKTSPNKFTINITTTTQDVAEMIGNVEIKNMHKTEKRLRMKNDYVGLIRGVSEDRSIRKRFFLVFEYSRGKDGVRATDLKTISYQMHEECYEIKAYFRSMNTEVAIHEYNDFFIGEVLYKYLNKKSCKKISFQQRINNVYSDACRIQKTKNPVIEPVSYVASNGMDTTHPEYLIVDGVYHTFLFLKKNGYVNLVKGGWFDHLTCYGEHVDVSMHCVEKPREQILGMLKQVNKYRTIDVNKANREGDGVKADELGGILSNSVFIKRRMEDYKEDIYDVIVGLTITGDSLQDVITLKGTIVKELVKDKEFGLQHIYGNCENAYRMSLPVHYYDPALMNQFKRNFLTSSIASTFPFTAHEMFDQTGEVWGRDIRNNTMVSINTFNTSKFMNANMAILGSSGSGKTFTEQCLGGRMCLNGKKVIFILPLKGHEYRRRCNSMDGSFVEVRPGGNDCINLFEIRPSYAQDEELIEGGKINRNLLTEKVTTIKTFLNLLLRDNALEEWEDDALDVHLTKLYLKFGITYNDDSIFDEEGNVKRMPIFSDFYEEIKNDPKMERVTNSITKFIDGSCKNFNGQTNVDLDNDYTILDVNMSLIPKNLQAPILFMTIDRAYAVAKESRTEEVVLILDELWKFMVNHFAAEFIVEMVKILRGYAAGCITATQDLNDIFLAGDMGKAILNNSSTKLILKTEYKDIMTLKDTLGLNEKECKEISKFGKGDVLLITQNAHITLKIEATLLETYFITTDHNILRQIAEAKKNDKDWLALAQ